ncbi:MAG: dihydropteroate synthase [Firmicutes bacterium]|nr:dihydropteroate synthase [Bacillota bacterium]MCL1953717.1 dihydropteroate synthase [Bacillota bacterium]
MISNTQKHSLVSSLVDVVHADERDCAKSQNTVVWGILNVTPDSFFDGGAYPSVQHAVDKALQMIKDGAKVIDIGGHSTRPNHQDISVQEELDRVIPVVQALKKSTNVCISVDTFRAKVAEESLRSGVEIINDIGGLLHDTQMASTVAKYNATVCIMHNRDVTNVSQDNIVDTILKDLQGSVELANSCGIANEQIVLDPGIGFGKTPQQNMSILKQLKLLKQNDFAWLLAASHKSVFGVLGLQKGERLECTIASSVYASLCGFEFVRVHDVAQNYRALLLANVVR